MKCELCRFAPPVNSEGYQDECGCFDKYGKVWKDGREGCTLSYQTLAKNERLHDEIMGEYATQWGLEHDFENHGWDIRQTIKDAAHMVGLDVTLEGKVFHGRIYHRHGKAFYRAYRNFYVGYREDFDYMTHKTFGYMVKKEGQEYPFYHLTERGRAWLSRQLKIIIKDRYPEDNLFNKSERG